MSLLRYVDVVPFCRHIIYCRRALQFVPGESAALQRSLQSLEEHDRKQLAIGEALQPDLAEQPPVFFVVGTAALQREGNCRSDKVDHQEGEEKQHQLVEAGGIGGVGMEMFLDEIPDRPHSEQ